MNGTRMKHCQRHNGLKRVECLHQSNCFKIPTKVQLQNCDQLSLDLTNIDLVTPLTSIESNQSSLNIKSR